jgi:hypothetical protein
MVVAVAAACKSKALADTSGRPPSPPADAAIGEAGAREATAARSPTCTST